MTKFAEDASLFLAAVVALIFIVCFAGCGGESEQVAKYKRQWNETHNRYIRACERATNRRQEIEELKKALRDASGCCDYRIGDKAIVTLGPGGYQVATVKKIRASYTLEDGEGCEIIVGPEHLKPYCDPCKCCEPCPGSCDKRCIPSHIQSPSSPSVDDRLRSCPRKKSCVECHGGRCETVLAGKLSL